MNKKKDEGTSGMSLPHGSNNRDAGHASNAPNPAVAVGERLAAARQEKGRSIDEMASRLKVAPTKIAWIEAGDLSHLHDATFAIGLVRSYAKVLGVDPDPLTDALRSVQRHTPDLSLPTEHAKTDIRRAHVPLTWSTRRSDRRSWVWGGLAAVVVLVLLVVWRIGYEPNGWLQRMKSQTTEAATSGTGSEAASGVSASALAQASTAEVADGTASGVVTSALAAPTQALAAAASEAGSAAAATLAAVSSASVSTSASAATGTAAGASAPLAPGATRVLIKAAQDSWMSFKEDGGRTVFSGIVRAGQSQVVDAVPPVRVVVGNVLGVDSMQRDGQPVDLKALAGPGKTVARFTLK